VSASASEAAPLPAARDRSIEARRGARLNKFKRERLIVDYLNRGVSVREIAVKLGVAENRMRARSSRRFSPPICLDRRQSSPRCRSAV
jgi:hypothetical protein